MSTGDEPDSGATQLSWKEKVGFLVLLGLVATMLLSISDEVRPPYVGLKVELAAGFMATLTVIIVYFWDWGWFTRGE